FGHLLFKGSFNLPSDGCLTIDRFLLKLFDCGSVVVGQLLEAGRVIPLDLPADAGRHLLLSSRELRCDLGEFLVRDRLVTRGTGRAGEVEVGVGGPERGWLRGHAQVSSY